MQDRERVFYIRKRLAVMAMVCLYSLGILYGCTRKEELVLTEDMQGQAKFQETSAETVQLSGPGEDGGQDMRKDGAAVAGQYKENAEDAGKVSAAAYIEEEPETVYVHVCGAVRTPGVYKLTAGSRVYEAVQAAGGFAEDAEESYVNQAQELPDGSKLVIPTREEAERAGLPGGVGSEEDVQQESGQQAADSRVQIGIVVQEQGGFAGGTGRALTEKSPVDDGRININTASAEELCKIPGIGASRAAAIITYREDHGGFKSPEDIMKVSGIKESTFEKIKDSISIE